MKDDELAREYADRWKITAIKEIGRPQYDLPSDVVKDIHNRLMEAFLAGRRSVDRQGIWDAARKGECSDEGTGYYKYETLQDYEAEAKEK